MDDKRQKPLTVDAIKFIVTPMNSPLRPFWRRLPRLWLAALLVIAAFSHAGAVEDLIDGNASFNTADPTDSDVANWDTGWGEDGIDGWDYVGQVSGASGIYLGNGWVLTAGHVAAGIFALDGSSYALVPGSAQGITAASGSSVDLTLFQIATDPDLPALTIESATPTAASEFQEGSQVVMIGFGGNNGKTWGYDTITTTGTDIPVDSFYSTDFETQYGTFANGFLTTGTNNATLVPGDSGGGDFVYDSSTDEWELAGVNEAIDEDHDSYMVQLSTYRTQIENVIAVPEPEWWGLAWIAVPVLAGLDWRRRQT